MAAGLSYCLCCLYCPYLSSPAVFAAPSPVRLAAAFALPSEGFVAVFPAVAAAHPGVFVVRLSVVAAVAVAAVVAAVPRAAALCTAAVADAVAPAAGHLAAQPVGVRWSPAGLPQDGSHRDCFHSAGGWGSRHFDWAGWHSVDSGSADSESADWHLADDSDSR